MQNITCSNCKSENAPGTKFCITCGAKMEEALSAAAPAAGTEKVCEKCGSPLKEGVKFCITCGTPVSMPAEPDPSVAVPKPTASVPQHSETRSAPIQPPVQTFYPPQPERTYAAPMAAGLIPPAAPSMRPSPQSPYEPISTWGYVGIFLLLMIPVIGLIFMIVWACGGCRKYNKRNLARAMLIFALISLALGVICYFAFSTFMAGWLTSIFGTADLAGIMKNIFGGTMFY